MPDVPAEAHESIAPAGSGAEERTAPHPTSVAVWGVPSPVVVNRRFAATVGVKCSAGCPLAGRRIVVRDEAGADVGHGRVGETPEPGTSALYATKVTLQAPAAEGVHAWTAAFEGTGPASVPRGAAVPPPRETASAHEATPGRDAPQVSEGAPERQTVPAHGALPQSEPAPPAHASAMATFGFRTVSPPEQRVTVTVCDQDTDAPLAGAEVRVGVYRGTTDASGQAHVAVHPGSYDLYVRKAGYKPHAGSVPVASGDVSLRVAAARVTDADLDDEQVWM